VKGLHNFFKLLWSYNIKRAVALNKKEVFEMREKTEYMAIWSLLLVPFLSVTLLLLLLPSMAFSSLTGEIRLSLVDGDVQVRPEGTEDWFPASVNSPVLEGDRIWVPDGGRLEMQLRDGTMVRLRENTSFDVIRIEGDAFQFYLNSGSAYLNFTGKKRYMQIDAPSISIRVYERAKFRVDISEDGRADVSTYSGLIYVESQRGRTPVRAGNMISIRDEEYAEVSPLGPSDEWERWNRDRDRRFTEKRYSYRYLPDELRPYSYDFDENGRWVYVREYGYVWTPTVIVSAGWAPYRHGRWVWFRGDYVWVSYEPWGWVPYHYGRWAFVASIGWCWVPPARGAVYWGPGFVGWVYTPTYVAWVPLAPGEIYYGYGYYGPHSVNIINIDINKVVVKEYRHAHIRDAITIVHKETFLRGRPVEVHVKENPFLAHKIHIGRPPIEPVRETRMPVIKEVIRGKEPPHRIREIDIKGIMQKRPLVKEKEVSVMRPGSRIRELPIEVSPKNRRFLEDRDKSGRPSIEEKIKPSRDKSPRSLEEKGPAFKGRDEKTIKPEIREKLLERQDLRRKDENLGKPEIERHLDRRDNKGRIETKGHVGPQEIRKDLKGKEQKGPGDGTPDMHKTFDKPEGRVKGPGNILREKADIKKKEQPDQAPEEEKGQDILKKMREGRER
jgi:hypothetical protein